MNSFEQLDAWQQAHQLVLMIYKVTAQFPTAERFGITSQLRRATCSVTSNIAEGFGRYHFKDKQRFYYHARGSLREIQSIILIARDLHYLSESSALSIEELIIRTNQLINGLIRSITEVSMMT